MMLRGIFALMTIQSAKFFIENNSAINNEFHFFAKKVGEAMSKKIAGWAQ